MKPLETAKDKIPIQSDGSESTKTEDEVTETTDNHHTIQHKSTTHQPTRRHPTMFHPGCRKNDLEHELRIKGHITSLEKQRATQILTQVFDDETKRVSALVDAEAHRRSQLEDTTDQTISSDCPICLDPVAYSANARFNCCGARLCMPCEVQWTAQERKHTTVLQCSSMSMDRRRSAWSSLKSLKQCPCCRTPTPSKEEQKVMLEEKMKQNKGWAYASAGLYMRDGINGYPKNRRKAFRHILKGAELGDSYAQILMAVYHEHGEGCKPSFEKAYHWMQKCVDKGMANGQMLMGNFYESGKFVKQDLDQAIRLYTLSAAQGSLGGVKSMMPLTTRDMEDEDKYNLAIYWSTKLAEHNSHVGYAMLAHLLHDVYVYYHCLTSSHDEFGCGVSPYPMAKRLVQRAKLLEADKAINRRDEFIDSPIQHYIDGVMKPINEFKLKCAGDCGKGIETGTPLRACSKCGVFHYCSKECQIKHWKVGHKHDCQKHWIQKFWKRNLLEE